MEKHDSEEIKGGIQLFNKYYNEASILFGGEKLARGRDAITQVHSTRRLIKSADALPRVVGLSGYKSLPSIGLPSKEYVLLQKAGPAHSVDSKPENERTLTCHPLENDSLESKVMKSFPYVFENCSLFVADDV